MRKIIQIAFRSQTKRLVYNADTSTVEPLATSDDMYALCDDGTIWLLEFDPRKLNTPKPPHVWIPCEAWPPIPQESEPIVHRDKP